MKVVSINVRYLPLKVIGCHGSVPLSDRKANVRLIIPTHLSTNPENLVKILLKYILRYSVRYTNVYLSSQKLNYYTMGDHRRYLAVQSTLMFRNVNATNESWVGDFAPKLFVMATSRLKGSEKRFRSTV